MGICALILFFLLFAGAAFADGPVGVDALHVEDGLLADADGQTVQLRGVSTHGLTWYPGFVSEDRFRQLTDDWDANLIRLAMYSENYCGGEREASEALMRKGIDAAIANDLYVLVDWHILEDDNPNLHLDEAMAFFDRILHRANVHLMQMSGGKYDLVRREETLDGRSQTGLDLDVLDHMNGRTRSVRTLSGGESFIASLSLALGLSEEIQASAGGIRLETMFVDEGFGSLDEDTLQQAMRALNSLSENNRLIGIISHVAELRRTIDKQIVVRRVKSGGSTIEPVAI